LETPMSPGGSQASAGEGLSPCNIGITQEARRLVPGRVSVPAILVLVFVTEGVELCRLATRPAPGNLNMKGPETVPHQQSMPPTLLHSRRCPVPGPERHVAGLLTKLLTQFEWHSWGIVQLPPRLDHQNDFAVYAGLAASVVLAVSFLGVFWHVWGLHRHCRMGAAPGGVLHCKRA